MEKNVLAHRASRSLRLRKLPQVAMSGKRQKAALAEHRRSCLRNGKYGEFKRERERERESKERAEFTLRPARTGKKNGGLAPGQEYSNVSTKQGYVRFSQRRPVCRSDNRRNSNSVTS
jgi:hypothetical protein